MEEDIKILEEKLKIIESLCTDDCINKSTVIQPLKYAIENLIKGYRKLEGEIKELKKIGGNKMYKIGDKIKTGYIGDFNPHSYKEGIIIWLRDYNYYPNGDYSVIEKRTQAIVQYEDGETESFSNIK